MMKKDVFLDAPKEFESPSEEINYWKDKLAETVKEFNTLQDNFVEFQESSTELENELEGQILKIEGQLEETKKSNASLLQTIEKQSEQIKKDSIEIQKLMDTIQEYKDKELKSKEYI